jgi:hypothetical protein
MAAAMMAAVVVMSNVIEHTVLCLGNRDSCLESRVAFALNLERVAGQHQVCDADVTVRSGVVVSVQLHPITGKNTVVQYSLYLAYSSFDKTRRY